MKKFILILTALILFPSLCWAQVSGANETVFNSIVGKLLDIQHNLQAVVMVAGGFGLIAIAYEAMLGKISWKRAGALGVGLILSGMSLAVIAVLTDRAGDGFQGRMAQHSLMYDHSDSYMGVVITPD